jgi:hypothetical protein
MSQKYLHLLETTTTKCSQKTYMIHPDYSWSDLTEEEKKVAYQSAVEWCDVHQEMINEMYEQVMKDFMVLKEHGLSSEEGKEIIERWTE